MKIVIVAGLIAASLSVPASAQYAPTNDPAPGSAAIMNSDYAGALKEIRNSGVSPFDPARSINLGVALAKTGERDKAAREFREVLAQDDVQIVVANGGTYSSHEVAERALAALQSGVLSR